MNIYRNILPVTLILSLLSGCSYANNEKEPIVGDLDNQCFQVREGAGEFDVNTYNSDDPQLNSYLLSCALGAFVPLVKESSTSIDERERQKLKVADFLIQQNLDVEHEDEDETKSNLLIAVTISYLPSDWKLKAAEILLRKGIDIDAKNACGYSALDLASPSRDPKLVEFLTEHSQKN